MNENHTPKRLPGMKGKHPGAVNERLVPVKVAGSGLSDKDMGIAVEQRVAIPEGGPNKEHAPAQNGQKVQDTGGLEKVHAPRPAA